MHVRARTLCGLSVWLHKRKGVRAMQRYRVCQHINPLFAKLSLKITREHQATRVCFRTPRVRCFLVRACAAFLSVPCPAPAGAREWQRCAQCPPGYSSCTRHAAQWAAGCPGLSALWPSSAGTRTAEARRAVSWRWAQRTSQPATGTGRSRPA